MRTAPLFLLFCVLAVFGCRTHYNKKEDPYRFVPGVEDTYATSPWWESFNDPVLNSLVDTTVSYNHDIKSALARICEARAAAKASSSSLFPDIYVSGTTQKYQFSDNGIFPSAVLEQEGLFKSEPQFFDVGFDAIWEIDWFGVNRNKVIAAKEQVCQAVESHYDLLISLVAEVAREYMILRKNQQIQGVLNNRLSIQKLIIDDLQAKQRTGLVSDIQLSQAHTRLKEIESEVAGYEALVETGIYKISILTGNTPKTLLPLLEEQRPLPQAAPFDPEYIAANVILQRPDVRSSERALKSQSAIVQSAKGMLMPNLWVLALYRLQSMKLSDLFKQGSQWWFAGPFVNWRLFERYELQANLQLENARHKRACEEYCQQVLIAYEDIESSYIDYRQSRIRLQLHHEALEISENTLFLTEKLLETGLESYAQFLQARAAHTIQQEKVISIEAQSNIQAIRLHKALGGGWKHFAYPPES